MFVSCDLFCDDMTDLFVDALMGPKRNRISTIPSLLRNILTLAMFFCFFWLQHTCNVDVKLIPITLIITRDNFFVLFIGALS